MDKQAQDRLWSELSEESKEKYRKDYKEAMEDCGESALIVRRELLAEIFGSHNLNPKQIKTWEDVAAQREYNIDVELNKIKNAWIGYPICDKMIATAKIAKLIDLGYGGMVSEEEWANDELVKYYIVPTINGKNKSIKITGSYEYKDKHFISFHTKQQAEEFMSHESNRKLVEMYYLM